MSSMTPNPDYQCFVCGRRRCLHKDNDRPPTHGQLATLHCPDCHGTGVRNRAQPVYNTKIPGRNDKCPCGSNRKYKICCAEEVTDKFKHAGSGPCKCVIKGYGPFIERVVKLPCSRCGSKSGTYCEHRPSLKDVVNKALRDERKERADATSSS